MFTNKEKEKKLQELFEKYLDEKKQEIAEIIRKSKYSLISCDVLKNFIVYLNENSYSELVPFFENGYSIYPDINFTMVPF